MGDNVGMGEGSGEEVAVGASVMETGGVGVEDGVGIKVALSLSSRLRRRKAENPKQ